MPGLLSMLFLLSGKCLSLYSLDYVLLIPWMSDHTASHENSSGPVVYGSLLDMVIRTGHSFVKFLEL